MNEEIEVNNHSIFFEKVKLREEEERLKDKVIDPYEPWKKWFKRNATFDEPPMIERDALPEELQPQKHIFSIVDNYVNGINPYPNSGEKKKSKSVVVKPQNKSDKTGENREFFHPERTHERDEYLDEEEKCPDKENDSSHKACKMVI